MRFPARFKKTCIACGASDPAMDKEHFWPQWLIRRTQTQATGVRFDPSKKINPMKMTIPLCTRCNAAFGKELEHPTSQIFDDLESGKGLSDLEAEILVRWLWKFEGLAWSMAHADGQYTEKYTLRDRVLKPIDDVRPRLRLAIAIVESIDPDFGDAPMGLDSRTKESAIFVSGVFSRIALMALLRDFDAQVPKAFSIYHFADPGAPDRRAKLFFPVTGFRNCVEAVGTTYESSGLLSYLHDTRSEV